MNELEEAVKQKVSAIEDAKVYYTLKMLNLRHISESQIQAVKVFVALRDLGFPVVTTNMFIVFYDKSDAYSRSLLHLLGDKGVITFVRSPTHTLTRYTLSSKFDSAWLQSESSNHKI